MAEGQLARVHSFLQFARENAHLQKKHFGKFVVTKRLYDLLTEYVDDNIKRLGEDTEVIPGPLLMRGVPIEFDEEFPPKRERSHQSLDEKDSSEDVV